MRSEMRGCVLLNIKIKIIFKSWKKNTKKPPENKARQIPNTYNRLLPETKYTKRNILIHNNFFFTVNGAKTMANENTNLWTRPSPYIVLT